MKKPKKEKKAKKPSRMEKAFSAAVSKTMEMLGNMFGARFPSQGEGEEVIELTEEQKSEIENLGK